MLLLSNWYERQRSNKIDYFFEFLALNRAIMEGEDRGSILMNSMAKIVRVDLHMQVLQYVM